MSDNETKKVAGAEGSGIPDAAVDAAERILWEYYGEPDWGITPLHLARRILLAVEQSAGSDESNRLGDAGATMGMLSASQEE